MGQRVLTTLGAVVAPSIIIAALLRGPRLSAPDYSPEPAAVAAAVSVAAPLRRAGAAPLLAAAPAADSLAPGRSDDAGARPALSPPQAASLDARPTEPGAASLEASGAATAPFSPGPTVAAPAPFSPRPPVVAS